MTEPIRVLHVDDEPGFADTVAAFLERHDDRFTVETATSTGEGLDRIAGNSFDCVVSDYDMPGGDGIEFLETVREESPELPFVLYTGNGSEEVASDAISAGVTDYLQKESGTTQYEVLANRIGNAVEQRRAREAVAETEQRLRTIAENANDVLWQFTADWNELLFVNSPYEEIWGRPVDELREDPQSFLDGVHPDDREHVTDAMEQLSAGESVDIEYRVNADENFGRWVWVQGDPVFDDAGEVDEVVGFARDVTDRKQRERELREKQRQLRGVLDTVEAAIFIKDTEGRYQLMNEECKELLGVGPDEEVAGLTDDDLLPADVAEQYRADDRRVLEQGETIEIEEEVPTGGGSQTNLTLKSPLYDAEGNPSGVCAVSTDITDRKAHERELQARSAAMEASIDGMSILDADEEYVFVNRAHADIYGYEDPDVFLGETWRMCYSEDELARFEEEVVPTLFEAGAWRGEAVGTRKDGSTFPQELSLTVTDGGGLVCVVRDITERKRQERELERQNERLEAFANTVSHDLRNPLTVAGGRLELAQDECDSEHLDEVANALDRSHALIDDLLTLARGGDGQRDPEAVDLGDVSEDCWRNVETPEATLTIDTERTIRADRSRLQQLLANLFRNAVEHGSTSSQPEADDAVEHGGEGVTVTIGDLDDGSGFYVEDDGPGIPEEKRGEVFRAGYSTATEGTGFGLNIVEEIASEHGWEISVTESDAGGARFEVTGVKDPQ